MGLPVLHILRACAASSPHPSYVCCYEQVGSLLPFTTCPSPLLPLSYLSSVPRTLSIRCLHPSSLSRYESPVLLYSLHIGEFEKCRTHTDRGRPQILKATKDNTSLVHPVVGPHDEVAVVNNSKYLPMPILTCRYVLHPSHNRCCDS